MKKYKPNITRITNKLTSAALLTCGIMLAITEGNSTFLVFASVFGVPLFFSKDKVMDV